MRVPCMRDLWFESEAFANARVFVLLLSPAPTSGYNIRSSNVAIQLERC